MLDDLRIRQLERALEPFARAKDTPRPPSGWLKAARQALGMSVRQVADRARLSKTAVTAAERSEARNTIQLDTLRHLAEAMECELVYALVPRDSLRQIIERQARRIAATRMARVSASMELEAQSVDSDERERQLAALTAEILRERGRGFWDVRGRA